MQGACASCSTIGRRAGAKFCHRCGRSWERARGVRTQRPVTAPEPLETLRFKAVGYRALAMIAGCVAISLICFLIVNHKEANDGAYFGILFALMCSVLLVARSGRYLGLLRDAERQMRARRGAKPARTKPPIASGAS